MKHVGITSPSDRRGRGNDGFTLVEILIVIVILGVLSTVVVFAVRGTTEQAGENTCSNERRMLETAAAAYMVQETADAVPATGVGNDRFEVTLVAAGILTRPSGNLDVDTNGDVSPEADGICD
ncbi:MAG: prepilin-type N-terminal cleavage/methylation domain-containing protein [Ilumatobacter sp.]|jgi:prepilin-type N-terminal cleavage/methylation domain-containing protein